MSCCVAWANALCGRVFAQAVQLTPVPILKRGADEERSETARLVSDVGLSLA